MIGKHVQEIAIKDMDWEKALPIVKSLVENEYAVMVTLEEELIIINYEYAADVDCRQSNRNYVTFMSNDELEDHEDKLLEGFKEDMKFDDEFFGDGGEK